MENKPSLITYNSCVTFNTIANKDRLMYGEQAVGYCELPSSKEWFYVLSANEKDRAEFGNGTFRIFQKRFMHRHEAIAKIDPELMEACFVDKESYEKNGSVKWQTPEKLIRLGINDKALFEKAFGDNATFADKSAPENATANHVKKAMDVALSDDQAKELAKAARAPSLEVNLSAEYGR